MLPTHVRSTFARTSSTLAVLGVLLSPAAALAAPAAAPLADAVSRQDKAALLALLKDKADVNAKQADGATAIHWAAHLDDMESAEALLKAGATVNAVNDYQVTPLSLAAENGSATMVARLLKAGANPNLATDAGETPLMTAVRAGSLPVVKLLLASGANVNAAGGGRDQTALMWATVRGQRDIMRVLIDAKADLNLQSRLRRDFVAFSRGNPQGGRQTGIADQTLESDGSRPGLRWINKGGMTALHFAAQQGDLESVKLLVEAGSNVNATTGIGYTSMMIATRMDEFDVVHYLLGKGANPNVDEAGHTVLHLAVARTNLPLVQALITKGADVNARLVKGSPDAEGTRSFNQLPEFLAGATPYLLASGLNQREMMRALAAAGANTRTPMLDGTTPTMAAMGIFPGVFQFVHFIKIPLERGARTDNPAYFRRTDHFDEWNVLETVKVAIELGDDINASRGALTTYHVGNSRTIVGRDVGDTALHIAVVDKLYQVAEFLVKNGAKLDVKDRRGFTPLALATSTALQFQTGGGGEPIGDVYMAEVLRYLGAKE
jgi:ankyrin repeat protein